jgi:hypothetical protein
MELNVFKNLAEKFPAFRWAVRYMEHWHILLIPHGSKGIKRVGHRRYVGGLWDEIGKLQLDFLINQGLRPITIY